MAGGEQYSGVHVLDPEGVDYTGAEVEATTVKPDDPPMPPVQWMKTNLFSSVANSILTVVSGLFALWAIRGILGFIFDPERRWEALATNMRLLLVKSYPFDQMIRVWVSFAILLGLTGLALGLSRSGALAPVSRIASTARNVGLFLILVGFLGPFELGGRIRWWIAGAVLVAVWFGVWRIMGDKARFKMVPMLPFTLVLLGILVGTLWVFPYGDYRFVDNNPTFEAGTVAMTSKIGWSSMWLTLVGAWAVGVAMSRSSFGVGLRKSMPLIWLVAPFFVTWVVMRDPDLDWDHVLSTDIPMFLGFAAIGGVILFFLSKPGLGEAGRLIAIALVVLGLATWVFAFFGWAPLWPMLQKARLSFLLLGIFALAAPTFAGETAKRLRFAGGWVGAMALLHYFATMINTTSTLEIAEPSFLGGATLSLFVATMTMIFSFPLGVLLALGRTSKLPIFRVLCTTFIEVVRGVPLISILFFFVIGFSLFLPQGMSMSQVAQICLGYSLFSAAYLAENVRGGLQSVRRGQFEAADALGLTGLQRTGLIVLPQALRVSIPPLVGQLIATYKETSLIYIVGGFDLLTVANRVISNQSDFLGAKMEPLIFVSFLYWVVAFSMSKYSQTLERKLGLGTR